MMYEFDDPQTSAVLKSELVIVMTLAGAQFSELHLLAE